MSDSIGAVDLTGAVDTTDAVDSASALDSTDMVDSTETGACSAVEVGSQGVDFLIRGTGR